MKTILILSSVLAMILTFLSTTMALKPLHKLKFGQTTREEGPEHHKVKNGTPTMGGILFIIITVILVLWLTPFIGDLNYITYSLIIAFLGYGIIGFIDDYIIVVQKNNIGLKSSYKLIAQIAVSIILIIQLHAIGFDTTLSLFNLKFQLSYIYYILIFFMLVASTNAVNLTDGIDGLATSVSLVSLFTFGIIAYDQSNYEILLFILILGGSLIGFLLLNKNPAKIFMGDTGSLALGGIFVVLAILLKVEFLYILIGGVFLIETLSVIIQVSYFKITGGKRIFKMSPIHHHFEYIGLSEKKIVLLFFVVQLVLSILALYLYFN